MALSRRIKVLGVIGRKGHISVADMEKDPNLDRRWIQTILKELCPEDGRVKGELLFCWNDVIARPRRTEKVFKKNIERTPSGKHDHTEINELMDITVNCSDPKEIASGKRQLVLSVREENKNTRIEFQIEYHSAKQKRSRREKPVFDRDSFKVVQFDGARERSLDYAFTLYRKSGMLYVYYTVYSNRDLTYVNKILDRSKEEEIKQPILDKIANYIKENPKVILNIHNARAVLRHYGIDPATCLTDSQKALPEKAGLGIKPRNINLETFGTKATFRFPRKRKSRSERVNRIIDSINHYVVTKELDKLKSKLRYWLYSLNARGLMKYCLVTRSEDKINKIIENLYSNRDTKYHYYQHKQRFRSEESDGHHFIQAIFESYRDVSFTRENDKGEVIAYETMTVEQFWTMIEREGWLKEENENKNESLKETKVSPKVGDLDFPFLLYHNKITKVLPQNFVAAELKQITKRLAGLIDNTLLHELTYVITLHYFNRFYEFMNMKPIIGKDSKIEEIKSKDANMYRIIMDYQVNILRYLRSIEVRKLEDTSRMLNLTNMLLEEEPKPHGRLAMQFSFAKDANGRLAILEPKLINQ